MVLKIPKQLKLIKAKIYLFQSMYYVIFLNNSFNKFLYDVFFRGGQDLNTRVLISVFICFFIQRFTLTERATMHFLLCVLTKIS